MPHLPPPRSKTTPRSSPTQAASGRFFCCVHRTCLVRVLALGDSPLQNQPAVELPGPRRSRDRGRSSRLRRALYHRRDADDAAALDTRLGRRIDQHRGHRNRRRGHCRPVFPTARVSGCGDRPRGARWLDLRLRSAGMCDRALGLQFHREEPRCRD